MERGESRISGGESRTGEGGVEFGGNSTVDVLLPQGSNYSVWGVNPYCQGLVSLPGFGYLSWRIRNPANVMLNLYNLSITSGKQCITSGFLLFRCDA